MNEIELRFHVPLEAAERLRQYLSGRTPAERQSLAAVYFDTADRQLAKAGIGLRLRRENRRRVQTCKGPSDDGMTRLEHNANLAVAAPWLPDLARHAEHPLGRQLAALQEAGLGELQPVFETRIQRLHRVQRLRGAQIELCWDEGELRAGSAATARAAKVHELELELLAGSPGALLAHAHALVTRLPLSLDLRSKAERGENLARGLGQRPARKAKPLELQRDMRPGEALRALLLNTFDQVARNASQIGCGDSAPEHVHQLRVGLRRLRTGLKLFAGLWPELAHPALPGFEEQAATWFRALGVVRDADVLHTGLSPQLQAALQAVCPDASLPVAATPPGGGAAAAAACVRQASAQQFLLEWMGWVELLGRNPMLAPTPLEPEALSLRRGLRRRLNRWHRQVQRDCAQFASLDIEARHRLRKRFKRLRYGVEFCASLFDAEALKRQLKPVVKAQEMLGELNDLELAITERRALSAEPHQDARAWFELGWLGARRTELLARSAVLMTAVAEAPKLL